MNNGNGNLINKSRISLARLFQKRLKVEQTSWSTKNKDCNRNGFGNYLASFSWARDTSKITLGKIQLCDGQVHGNDVDKIGWSVFTCLLSLGCLISHWRVRNRPNSGLVCKCYAFSEHALFEISPTQVWYVNVMLCPNMHPPVRN